MKIFHIGDLHIGKQLHQYNLKQDQEFILNQIVEYAKKEKPDAVLITGDIYDRAAPSAEAVGVFDVFLTELSDRTIFSLPIVSRARKMSVFSGTAGLSELIPHKTVSAPEVMSTLSPNSSLRAKVFFVISYIYSFFVKVFSLKE